MAEWCESMGVYHTVCLTTWNRNSPSILQTIKLTPFSADTKNTLIPDFSTPNSRFSHQNILIHIFLTPALPVVPGTNIRYVIHRRRFRPDHTKDFNLADLILELAL